MFTFVCFISNLYAFEQNRDRILLNLSSAHTDSKPAGKFTSRAGWGEKPWGGQRGCRGGDGAGAGAARGGPLAMARRLCRATAPILSCAASRSS